MRRIAYVDGKAYAHPFSYPHIEVGGDEHFEMIPSGTVVVVNGEEFTSGDMVEFKHDGVDQRAPIFQILVDDYKRVVFEVWAADGLLKIGAMTRRGLGHFYVKDESGRTIARL